MPVLRPAGTLADTIRRTARLLRDGGRLIAQVSDPRFEAVIEPALAAAGRHSYGMVADNFTGRLVVNTVTKTPKRA